MMREARKQREHYESKQTADARTLHKKTPSREQGIACLKASRFCLQKPSGKL
jgi:hypothetical protein